MTPRVCGELTSRVSDADVCWLTRVSRDSSKARRPCKVSISCCEGSSQACMRIRRGCVSADCREECYLALHQDVLISA